jgi:hypothetical protein
MSFYYRDSSVPFWRANVDVDSLFAAHAHCPARAQAWLKFRDVSECSILEQAVMMRGHFELGLLSDHTYHWTFTPTHAGGVGRRFIYYGDRRSPLQENTNNRTSRDTHFFDGDWHRQHLCQSIASGCRDFERRLCA